MIRSLRLAGACLLIALWGRAQTTVNVGIFQLDFTYDTSGYFTGAGNSAHLTTLENAAQMVSSLVSATTLSAITPGSNSWTPSIQDPTTSTSSFITPSDFGANSSLAASTIKVYIGAQGLGGIAAGATTTQGTFSANPNTAWLNTLNYRGNGTNYMPWGGTILFNTTVASGWYFDANTTLTAGEIGSANDFLSVATHELFHLLGFGTSATWTGLVSSGTFTGSHAEATYGSGAVPLNGTDHAHWANNAFTSVNLVTGATQETMMDPSLTSGTRKYPTQLDAAALQDIGYTVNMNAITAVPEPANVMLLAGASALLFAIGRRVQTKRRHKAAAALATPA